MERRLAIVCSGQGGQHAEMAELFSTDIRAWRAWENWQEAVLSFEMHELGWREIVQDSALLFANRYAQAMVVGYGLAAWAALAPQLPRPALVAGYSVGELTAYGVSGGLAIADVRRLVIKRALLMDQAALLAKSAVMQAQGMLALSGIPWADLQPLFERHQVYLAIDNGIQSCVLGGAQAGLEQVANEATALGAQTRLLMVSVAAHTPLMAEAVDRWLVDLRATTWSAPACPVLSGLSGARVRQAEMAAQSLAQQLAAPVRWADCMDTLAEAGINVVLELGPGGALAHMMQARHPQIECRALADFSTLAGAAQWATNQ